MTTDTSMAATPHPATAPLQPPPRRRTARWIWALLIASLALNLLIIGIIGGSLWAVKRGGLWDAPLFLERTHRFMTRLPAERRKEIGRIFAEYKPQLAPSWGEVRQARVSIGRLIERDYTPEQLDEALGDLSQKEARAREMARPMIAAMLAALQPRERRLFLAVYMPYLAELQGRPETNGLP
jgi:uncharacterized membrane protein